MTIPLLLTMPISNEKLQVEFKQIYLEFNNLVRSVAYRMVGTAYLDDLVQDVFLKVWKNLKKFKKQSSLKTWIYKITMNTCYDFLKKKRIQTTVELDAASTDSHSVDTAQAINKALHKLSPKHRSAIVLLCYEGLSLEEASHIEQTNIGTMKSRVSKAKKQMREQLIKFGVNYV